MKLVISKVPESQTAVQFSHLGRILDFAGAPDRRVACSASVPASTAMGLQAQYATVRDWARTLTGGFSSTTMLENLAAERVLSLHAQTETMRFVLEPENERPFQDWNGEWKNQFRIVVIAEEKGAVITLLDRFALERGLNLFRSDLHDNGRIMTMCGFKALSSAQVKEVWAWFLQNRFFPVTTKGDACYVGEIASLPGLGGGSAFESGAEMHSEIVFGEVAKQLAALNLSLDWAQGFYEALSAVSGERPVAFCVARQYLNWKTIAGDVVRGSSGNAVMLKTSKKVCELTAEFEQFTNSAPKASALKAGFQRFWSEWGKGAPPKQGS
ncbi:MAG: hypothetical protein ABIR80_09490 [Opitutaceae bacterium]